jgi:hypothetical protein
MLYQSILLYTIYLFLFVIIQLTCNLHKKTFTSFNNTYYEERWSSSAISELLMELLCFHPLSSVLGYTFICASVCPSDA